MKPLLLFALFFLSFEAFAQSAKFEIQSNEFIFGDERPFAQCHASSIERLGNGEYIITWFAGSHEKNDDVGIWMSKGESGNWTQPKLVAKIRDDAHWNPVLFHAPDEKLYLYFKVGKEIDDWETWVQYSEDRGNTWSEPKELVSGDRGGRGPVRNHLLALSDSIWLAPASVEKEGIWNAFVDRTEDGGETWLETETLILDRNVVTGEGVIQPALWESTSGNIHMLLRTSAGKIGRSDSEDFGHTWDPVYLTDLPNNNSGIDVVKIKGEAIALVYNPVGENWGKRYPMQLAISYDNGKTWPVKEVIENGSGDNEFSYPSIIVDEGYLIFCYTWNREKIKFVKVKLD